MGDQARNYGIHVFLDKTHTAFAPNFLHSFVITCLDTGEDLLGIRDVRLEKNDGAFVQTVGH